jgi:hypothetical protein
LSERRGVLKKCLTGPTLLEMSGYGVNRELRREVSPLTRMLDRLAADVPVSVITAAMIGIE